MPFTLAYHTTFLEQSVFAAPIGLRYQVDDNYIPSGDMLPLTPAEQEFVKGENPTGKAISGFYTAAGNQAKIGDFSYCFSTNFDNIVLYNGGGEAGFVCISPLAISILMPTETSLTAVEAWS